MMTSRRGRAADGRRTLVVHVGATKTGSTSIQHMLGSLSGALELAGIHVPVAARSHNGNHWNLAYLDKCIDGYDPDLGGWADLAEELRRCAARRFVVSSELFTNGCRGRGYTARVAALARDLALDIEIVGYVRPQYQRLEALYAQRVNSGHASPPFEMAASTCQDDPELDYNVIFQPWLETFGNRLTVYPLEVAERAGGLLTHFLGVLGAGELAAAAAGLPRRKERPGAKCLEVLRRAGITLAHRMVDLRTRTHLLWRLRRDVPAMLAGDAPFAGLSHTHIDAVTEKFAESNARFARRCGIDADGNLFRETGPDALVRPNRGAWTDLSVSEAVQVLELVRDAAGVDIASVSSSASGNFVSQYRTTLRQLHRGMKEPCSAFVHARRYRQIAAEPLEAFTPARPVSVLVLCPAGPDGLARTLAALERQTYPKELVEIMILAPGGARLWDGFGPPAPNVRMLQSENGIPEARNKGVQAAANDLLVFLDGGMVADPRWLAAHARWHHYVSDAVTIGTAAFVAAGGTETETTMSARGPVVGLCADDWAEVLARASFGISRRFFETVGGFDASLSDPGTQEIDFGNRIFVRGGMPVPVAEARVLVPGTQPHVSTDRGGTTIPDSRLRVPKYTVTVTATTGMAQEACETARRLLRDHGSDLVILLDIPQGNRAADWLDREFRSDPRVRFSTRTAGAHEEFPATPFHIRIPAGANAGSALVHSLVAGLGDAVAGTSCLRDGACVSITRAWALHRAQRAGRKVADFGSVVTIAPGTLQPDGIPLPVHARWAMQRTLRYLRSAAGASLTRAARLRHQARWMGSQMRSVRTVHDVPRFLRWLRWDVGIRCRRELRRIAQRFNRP